MDDGNSRDSDKTAARTRRIRRVLRARLQSPIIHLLLLLPLLPREQHNLVYTALPFYRSCKALLARHGAGVVGRRKERLELVQWTAYWLIFTLTRACEKTRLDLGAFSSPAAILSSIAHLPSHVLSRLSALYLSPLSQSDGSPTSKSQQTLAVQLAGTPRRWTVLKAALLFFAMDTELQGARWILEKLCKPIAGFFTGVEGLDPLETTEGDRGLYEPEGHNDRHMLQRSSKQPLQRRSKINDEGRSSVVATEGDEDEQMPELSMEDETEQEASSSSTSSHPRGEALSDRDQYNLTPASVKEHRIWDSHGWGMEEV